MSGTHDATAAELGRSAAGNIDLSDLTDNQVTHRPTPWSRLDFDPVLSVAGVEPAARPVAVVVRSAFADLKAMAQ